MAETKRITVPAAEELLGLYFPIHDHGFIGLKDYMGGDDSIEGAARGSYAYGTRIKTDQRNLLRSLMRRRHTSPFEQVEIVVHAAMPIMVARQWVRHRTASLNEMSGRYSLMPMLFYTPEDEQIKKQSKLDKQGRDGALRDDILADWCSKLAAARNHTSSAYKWATENDIARELARIDLPLSTYTQWVWKIDLHNALHALGLRCDLHAQWETRQYFNAIAGMVKRLTPIAFEAWEDYHFYAKRFSRMEMNFIRHLVQPNYVVMEEGPNAKKIPTLSAATGCWVDAQMLRDNYQLSKTEVEELMAKFKEPEIINFDLDLSQAKEPSFFEEKFRKAAEE